MKVTVITVSFNSAATLADTLQSVARQSHSEIEHLLIDGGSRDGTAAVVAQYGQHLAAFISEPDRGIYDAMNKGLRMATGDLIGFLNADDMFAHENVLSRMVEEARGSRADVVYGDLVYVTANAPHRVVRRWRTGRYSPSRLRFGWMPPHPTFYVRRSLLKEVSGFDLEMRLAADYDFMLRCLLYPGVRVHYLPTVLVHMRIGGASNRSVHALLENARDNMVALRKNKIGGVMTLLCKRLRKLPQFLTRN